MARGTTRLRAARLCLAALVAVATAITLGPDDSGYQSYALGLAALVLLGGWIRSQTDEAGLAGRIATGALGVLLLAPAVGIRVSKVSEASFVLDQTSPHLAVFNLPEIAAGVVQATGPMMLGAGLALIILGGRLGGTVMGAILGGATGAWAGQTLTMQVGRAFGAEHFDEVVMLSQGLRFVGLLSILGAIAGAVLAQQGRVAMTKRRLAALTRQRRAEIIRARELEQAAARKAATEEALEEAERKKAQSGGASNGKSDGPLSPEDKVNLEAINAALYATPLLHVLDDEELETIATSFERRRYQDGDDLFLERDKDATIFIICRGEVQIWRSVGEGERFVLARLSAGSFFGEMAVIEGRPRSASATARGCVEVVTLSGDAYRALGESQPAITTKVQVGLIQLIAKRLRSTSRDLLLVSDGEEITETKEGDDDKAAPRAGSPVEPKDIASLVAPARLFRDLVPDELRAIAPMIEQIAFMDKDHLVEIGARHPSMILVCSGQVQIWHRNAEDEKVVIAHIGPGTSIGEMALFENGQRSAMATAIGEVQALRISREAIAQLTDGHPKVAVKLHHALLEVLSGRLRRVSTQLVDASTQDSEQPASGAPLAPEAGADPDTNPPGSSETGPDVHLWVDEEPWQDEDEQASEDLEEEEEEEEEEEIIVELSPEEVDPDGHLSPALLIRHKRTTLGLGVLATLIAYWTASPPWQALVRTLPSPGTSLEVPSTEPGLPNAQRPMNPFGPDFAAALDDRGHIRLHSRPWPCLPDVYDRVNGYGSHPRGTETLAVAASTKVVDLTPAIHDMRKRGVYRMGLTGQAAPPYGLLGAFLAWPAVQLLLDSPPRTVQWIKLHPRHLEKLPLLPGASKPRACALLVDEEVTVDHIYATARSLSSVYGDPSCQQAVVLVLPDDGSTTNSHPGWRGCP